MKTERKFLQGKYYHFDATLPHKFRTIANAHHRKGPDCRSDTASTKKISIRLTEVELDSIKKNAKKVKKSPTVYCRNKILGGEA